MAHDLIKPLHLQGGGFETFPSISEPLKKKNTGPVYKTVTFKNTSSIFS